VRRRRGVSVFPKTLLAEAVEADEDRAMPGRGGPLRVQRSSNEKRRGNGADALDVANAHR
jgi:hypothetical protein